MLFCKKIDIFNFIIFVKFAGITLLNNVFEFYLIKYIKYREQIQIQAFYRNQIQIRKIQIQIRKYKYVFDPIPAYNMLTHTFYIVTQTIFILFNMFNMFKVYHSKTSRPIRLFEDIQYKKINM